MGFNWNNKYADANGIFLGFFFMFVIRETLIYISENIDITKVLITLGLVPFSVNHWGEFFFKKAWKI